MSCEPPDPMIPLLCPRQVHHPLDDTSDDRFWTTTDSAEITSNECLSEVRSLLTSPSKIALARSLGGSEAQKFIDFLDQVLAQSSLDHGLWRRSLRLLSKICRACRIVPSSYILRQELLYIGRIRFHGGFADVSEGEYSGRHVAIKRLKVNEGSSDRIYKRLCREIINWKYLSHPNILPLSGVSASADPYCFCIVTEWMPNGNIMQYATSNPEENRLRLLSEVMSAVAYLHSLRIVHGDLKGANILIDDTGIAQVADFGLMTMVEVSTILLSGSSVPPGGTFCWMSPELLDPASFRCSGRPTRESDCYALGMVVYEVLTGRRPFHDLCGYTPVAAVLRGERPEKPLDTESLGLSDVVWGLVQSCWSESPSSRPTARQLLDCLSSASLTWVPPLSLVYPAVFDGNSGGFVTSDSSGSLRTSPRSSARESGSG